MSALSPGSRFSVAVNVPVGATRTTAPPPSSTRSASTPAGSLTVPRSVKVSASTRVVLPSVIPSSASVGPSLSWVIVATASVRCPRPSVAVAVTRVSALAGSSTGAAKRPSAPGVAATLAPAAVVSVSARSVCPVASVTCPRTHARRERVTVTAGALASEHGSTPSPT